MASVAIICLGNRYMAGDDVGCRVFEHLAGSSVPPGIEIIDGGLCGLDLLRLMEGKRRVVFADAVAGLAPAGETVLLTGEQVVAYAGPYGHSAGLPYLIRMMPQVCDAPVPEITLLGVQGEVDDATIAMLAKRCLEVAIHGT